MPIGIMAIVNIVLIIHVLKTNRPYYWVFVILIPGIGAVAYIIAELLPELFGSYRGKQALHGVRKAIDPKAGLRQRQREHQMSGSVDAARHLAGELLDAAQFKEAITHYENTLTGLYEHDPDLLLGLATAQFGDEQFEATVQTLDRLIENNPDFRSADGHLVYARAIEACGDDEKAEEEYAAVAAYYAGAEAKIRYGLLLEKLGKNDTARQQYEEIIAAAELAPRHYKKLQREWIKEARDGINRTEG